ncbi:MAG: S-layer homology domain-containing protein [Clostridia bacterium]
MKVKMKMLVTSIIIISALTVSSFAAVSPFIDLEGVSAKTKILDLQEAGIIKGVGNTRFSPKANITAAQGIQLIVNALKLNIDNIRFIKAPLATDYFTKANNEAWYATALIIASVKGMPLANDLDPNQAWTKEEFTYQLIQAVDTYANLPMIKLVPIKLADQAELTVSYDGAIQRALAYGVIKLDSAGKFQPKAKITRAAAAEQIYNALEYIKAHPAPLA